MYNNLIQREKMATTNEKSANVDLSYSSPFQTSHLKRV